MPQACDVLGARLWPSPSCPLAGCTSSQIRFQSSISNGLSSSRGDAGMHSTAPVLGDPANTCPALPLASASASSQHQQLYGIAPGSSTHVTAPDSANPGELPPYTITAHTSLEDSLGLVLSPTQLGTQLWEGAHTSTGLPWWAAIPAATLAVRGLLLPLSLRAYAASSNIALLHRAFGLSGEVAAAVASVQESSKEQQQQQHEAVATVESGEGRRAEKAARSSGARADGQVTAVSGQSIGRVELVRRVLSQLRAKHRAPAFRWYVANAAVQVPLAVSLTLSLRRMCESLWPGLTSEGLLYFQDLTAPPMYLSTLSTPYGTAGAILPLTLVLLYVSAADRSAGATSPGIHTALKLLVLPLYCAALLQPHAVLLYWLSLAATQVGLYELATRVPAVRRAAGLPDSEVPPPAEAEAAMKETGADKGGVVLDELLLALSESYDKSGNKTAARTCLAALIAREPNHPMAQKRLQTLAAPPSSPPS